MKVDELDRHIILWAKGHYNEYLRSRGFTIRVDQLKQIQGKVCCLNPEYLDTRSIYLAVVRTFVKYVKNEYDLENLFLDAFRLGNDRVECEDVIFAMSGKLAILRVKDKDELILDLGEPDLF